MDAAQVMEGMIMGTLDAEFKDIEHCVQDGEAIIQDVENAFKDFKSRDFHDIMEGLKAVGHALMEVKSAVTDCQGSVGDFEKLTEMAVIFSNVSDVSTYRPPRSLSAFFADKCRSVTSVYGAGK